MALPKRNAKGQFKKSTKKRRASAVKGRRSTSCPKGTVRRCRAGQYKNGRCRFRTSKDKGYRCLAPIPAAPSSAGYGAFAAKWAPK